MMEWKKYLWAFVIGGLLCVAAQLLIDRTKLTPARILVSYVVAVVRFDRKKNDPEEELKCTE